MTLAGSMLFLCNGALAAELRSFHNGLSMQGFTGILNTPSAHVTREGDFFGLYSNQEESKWRKKTPFQDNYFFNVGFFSFAEIGGTLFVAPRVGTDLSASLKLTSEPFFRKYKYAPVLALGIQDISGGLSFLKTKYAVISEDIWRFRISAGYGTGPDRMKGGFAGGEFKAHDWLYLLADYDTKETNVGARAVLPHFWKVPISFTATAKTSLNHQPGNFDIAVGFSLPLDFKVRKEEQAEKKDVAEAVVTSQGSRGKGQGLENPASPASPASSASSASLEALRNRLVKAGFMNVRVGHSNTSTAVVEYENVVFNHNELDALGVITGMAVETLKGNNFENLRIVIKRKNIRMLQLTMPIQAAADFLASEGNQADLKSRLEISSRVDDNVNTTFIGGDQNSSFLATSFVLWPGLNTRVGVVENGGKPFEYRLSLKPDLYVNLWKGSLLNARWDIPVSWSDKMDDGKMYSIMERLMIFQGIKLLPNVMANLGGGMLMHDLYGTMNELVWQPRNGNQRIRLAQTWAENGNTHRDMESYLASYRYYFSPLDMSLEGTVGKFWSQDRGFSVELKRFFGDTFFSVYYKNSTTSDSKHWQAGGVQFAFPLTPEKDMKHYYKMQLRGTDEWVYAQETTFKNKNVNDGRGEVNYVPDVPLAAVPALTGSLHNQYLNRDRLNVSYITANLERLRDAWVKYKDRLD